MITRKIECSARVEMGRADDCGGVMCVGSKGTHSHPEQRRRRISSRSFVFSNFVIFRNFDVEFNSDLHGSELF